MIQEKEDNMIDETKLNKRESILFIICLNEELKRYKQAHHSCVWFAYLSKGMSIQEKFWTLGAIRHLNDMEMIKKSINYLKKKWSL